MRRRLAAALLALAPMVAPAQDAPAPAGEPAPARRVLLYMVALPGSEIGDEDLLVLYESLVARLVAEAPSLVPIEAPAVGRAPASPEERSREAWREGGDAWVWIAVGRDGGTLRAQSLDVAAGGEIHERTFETASGSGPQAAWGEVVAEMKTRIAGPAAARAEQPAAARTADVRIRAASGTRISGLAGEEIVVGLEGEAEVSLAAPAAYRIVAIHPGYLPVTRSFYVDRAPVLIELGQKGVSRWAFELALSKLAYPSFEAQWLAVPERLFVTLGAASFAVGVPLWGKEDDTRVPLTQVAMSANLYFGRQAGALRPYAGAELFLRLVDDGGEGWFGLEMDPVSKAGFGIALGVELSRHPTVRPFIEANPQAYLLAAPDQIELYFDTIALYRDNVPLYVIMGPILADLFNFEIGVRIRL